MRRLFSTFRTQYILKFITPFFEQFNNSAKAKNTFINSIQLPLNVDEQLKISFPSLPVNKKFRPTQTFHLRNLKKSQILFHPRSTQPQTLIFNPLIKPNESFGGERAANRTRRIDAEANTRAAQYTRRANSLSARSNTAPPPKLSPRGAT